MIVPIIMKNMNVLILSGKRNFIITSSYINPSGNYNNLAPN